MAEGNPIKYSDLVIDDGAIEKLLNAIDTLEKRFLQSQKNFRKEIEKTKKSTEDFTGATEDQESELEKLEKQLEKLIKANKELQETDGQLAEQKKQAVKIAKDEAKLRKKLIELDSEQTKVNAELKIDISERNRLLKEQIKREKGLTNAYDDESKSLNNLRKKYKALAVEVDKEDASYILERIAGLKMIMKNYSGAMLDYSKTIELNPNYTMAYVARAELKYFLNNLRGACEDWEKASSLDPSDYGSGKNARKEIKKYCN